MPDPVTSLRAAVDGAIAALGEAPAQRPTLERPPQADLGDYSTNAAMLLAPIHGGAPREIAERLSEGVREALGGSADRVEVAGPGFLNLFLSDRWHREATAAVLAADQDWGAGEPRGERVLVEFVSPNPTGPLTAAGGRHAAYGDSLSRALEKAGYEVERECYLNDTGGQVARFAASIAARMAGQEPPEDGYAGEYVSELAERFAEAGIAPEYADRLGVEATAAMKESIEGTLERFRVRFDRFSSERALHDSGAVDAALAVLGESGHTYESEGALWLRTTDFGDDKDRVLLRAGGEPTYFAGDVAYHRDKLERGADHLINVLGADHHGYVARMGAAIEALGFDRDRFEALIMQLVQIVEGGERTQMSKRKGQFVALDELIDDIGVDAARFFMVQRSHDTAFDLDLDLARSESQDNPVYYVQYAHARIASILRKAVAEGAAPAAGEGSDEQALIDGAHADEALASPAEPAERELIRRLLEMPAEVGATAARRAPHRLAAYATATAADFHAFYRDCQVVGADGALEPARLGLCVAVRRVLAATLDLLGVSAPERM
jgi:arginyl-tRNA synthetase